MKWLFVILSLLDYTLTVILLNAIGEDAEANPIAASVYQNYGEIGLAIFKAGTVVSVIGIMEYVLTKKPKYVKIYWLFCFVTALAVIFGVICNVYVFLLY